MAFEIIATIGPASRHLSAALAAAGATAFRLNASHLDPHGLGLALDALRAETPTHPVVVDLQGAKMRLGHLDARPVAQDERITFSLDGSPGVPLPHPEFFEQVKPGDTISVDDGRLRFVVRSSGSDTTEVTARLAGRLLPRKGVNVEEHPVLLRGLTAGDRRAIEIAGARGVRAFAFSFMTDGREARWLREQAPGCTVAGKVERREAVGALDTIATAADSVWICRGDLGVQLGDGPLAAFVAALSPRRLKVPVLMAGQVLEHLTRHREPTRSETCHLFDLVGRGYAGIVLSDETAIGDDPVHAVAAAAALLASFRA